MTPADFGFRVGALRRGLALLLSVSGTGFVLGFLPGCWHGRIGCEQVSPFQLRGVEQRRDVGFPGFELRQVAGHVRHIGDVVFVGESGHVMAKLVYQDVVGEGGVDGDRRLIVVDAAASVLGVVEQDDQVVVRCGGGRVADTCDCRLSGHSVPGQTCCTRSPRRNAGRVLRGAARCRWPGTPHRRRAR